MAGPDAVVAAAAGDGAATGRAERSAAGRGGHRRDAAYWLYLMPGAVLFVARSSRGPLVYNVYLSLTKWSGVGDPSWVGLDNYRTLLQRRASSGRRSRTPSR